MLRLQIDQENSKPPSILRGRACLASAISPSPPGHHLSSYTWHHLCLRPYKSRLVIYVCMVNILEGTKIIQFDPCWGFKTKSLKMQKPHYKNHFALQSLSIIWKWNCHESAKRGEVAHTIENTTDFNFLVWQRLPCSYLCILCQYYGNWIGTRDKKQFKLDQVHLACRTQ